MYNNKAITQIEKNDYGSAVDYLQKSYYFYPDNQVRYMLYNSLLYQIEKCDFEKVSDIDYIGQFSRFGENDMNLTTTMFGNVINNKLQYSNKEQYCDSLYKRICKFIPNQKMKNEIDFSFNLIMAIRFQNKEKGFNYALNAVQIKSNHNDANNLFIRQLSRKVDNIYDPKALLDSISIYKSKFESEQVTDFLNKNQQIAYLNLAKKAFDKNNLQEGEKYVLLFESNSKAPIENSNIRFEAEKTYYAYSAYFYRKQNKTARSNVIKRGLKYLPDSYMLKIGN